MSTELSQLLARFETLWPLTGAEEWDAPGLVSGEAKQRISRVLLTVDVTSEIVEEAIDGGFDLILAHHPFMLRGITSASEDTSKGSTLAKAIRANLAIYAAHTNADIVEAGVSDVLAMSLGVQNAKASSRHRKSVDWSRPSWFTCRTIATWRFCKTDCKSFAFYCVRREGRWQLRGSLFSRLPSRAEPAIRLSVRPKHRGLTSL